MTSEQGPKNIIDVHSHFFAPELWQGVERILGPSRGVAAFDKFKESKNHMQRFNAQQRVEWMDRFGIEKSVLSFPSVPIYMGAKGELERPQQRKDVSLFLNDYFAEVHSKYPQRLLFYADVPLSVDVEFSCKELHRAIEELGLHGVGLPTNIGGKRPSEPEFEEFFAEAEKLETPLYFHPQNAFGMEQMVKYMVYPMIGYPAETSLTATYMILDGFLERHPNIKIILCHLGGFIPYLHRRLNSFTEATSVDPALSGKANLTKRPSDYLRHFFYDTAMGNSEALELCLKVIGADRILFGTDHPYVELAEAKTTDYISKTGLSSEELDAIYSENAKKLFAL